MAKGGKGRKGGGGGGGKTRKYSRDNNGRFAATGTGATARGGRLLTAKGNKRTARALAGKTKTIEAAGKKGVLAKPKGLKPGSIKAKAAGNKIISSPRRLSGDQKIARDVMTNKKLTSDRQRVAEMQRRGIKPGTDMVGLVASVRAKQGGDSTSRIKPAAKPSAAAKPAKAKTVAAAKSVKATERQRNVREFMDQKGGSVARDYKKDAQAFRQPLAKKDQTAGGPKTVGGALELLASKSYKRAVSKTALTQSESTRAQKLISDNNIKGYKIVRGERGDLLQRVSGVSGKSASLGEAAASRKASRKPATAAKPSAASAAAKPAKPARFSASELAERKGYAKQLMAQPKGVRKANYLQRKAQKNPDQLDKFKGRMKFGTQNTINNITEGRSYLTAKKSQFANTPERRAGIERSVTNSGRSLQARMKTTNLGTRLRRLNKPVTAKAAKIKGTIGKPKGLKPGNIKPKAAAVKPTRATRTPKTGQEVMKSEVRKVQNKRLRDLNADIKSAGPSATSLRVEKLALKTKMIDTQPRQTAKQLAKSAKQDVVIRGRIAEMRKQNARVARAQSNVTKNADVRNSTAPMSKASFARRPSKKTMRSQLRADNALDFYANPAKALQGVNKRKPGFRKPRTMR